VRGDDSERVVELENLRCAPQIMRSEAEQPHRFDTAGRGIIERIVERFPMSRRRTLIALAAFTLSVSAFISAAGPSEVADAAMKGDRVALKALLQRKVDPNTPQVDGATALHWAVYRDDLDAVDLLLSTTGIKVDATNREGVTPLAMACLYGNVSMINKLVKAGANVKQLGPNGQTMLMLAARNGQPEAIYLLVSAGADVNAKEPLRGTTALMWAAEQKHPAAVKALLESGADVAAKTGPAGLPRNYMAGRVNVNAVQTAVKRRAAAAAAGRTYEEQLAFEGVNGRFGAPTGQAAGGQQQAGGRGQGAGRGGAGRGAAANGGAGGAAAPSAAGQPGAAATPPEPEPADDEVIVAGLVGSGGGGLTALVFAAREGDAESVEQLLRAGANVNQTTEYGWTPLLTATNNRHYKLGELLIEWGADPNISNKGGWTPLYLATDNRNIEGGDYPVPKPDMDHLEYIQFLLDHGANPNLRAKDNTLTRTIFTMQWFQEAGATPFVRAAQSSDTALMKLLLAYGADPKLRTDFGDTALTAAAGIGWVEGVTYERSAKDNIEAVKMLLDLGLDPNGANNDGRTPLMGAAMKGRNEVVQMLVDKGAKLDARDNGSRDTDTVVSVNAGHTWEALDYADGLVRVGVQSAVNRAETAALIRKLMTERGLPVPPVNRTVDSICIVEICKERVWQ
jgi:ankyrin repeat protein